jgi:DNA primase
MALDLPQTVRDVIVLADGDDAGKAAARGAALRWKREGRRVRIAYPSEGTDFNDMLLGRAPKIQEGVQ